jgi:threonine aldolase
LPEKGQPPRSGLFPRPGGVAIAGAMHFFSDNATPVSPAIMAAIAAADRADHG